MEDDVRRWTSIMESVKSASKTQGVDPLLGAAQVIDRFNYDIFVLKDENEKLKQQLNNAKRTNTKVINSQVGNGMIGVFK